MKNQTLFPRPAQMGPHNTIRIRTLGLEHPQVASYRSGSDWQRQQVLRHDNFLLSILEGRRSESSISYTRQEDYIKVNFWLGGRHTTILDGFGQHEHESPEVFITAGPWEMVKVDVCGRNAQVASVALCVQRDFFSRYMGLDPDQLPEPLRGLLTPEATCYAFHRFPLSPDLTGAVRSILAAPTAVRQEPIYTQAKAVELMCLLINRMQTLTRRVASADEPDSRLERRLHEARDFVERHHAQAPTLERICREVGLNRMALTGGFRRVFGMSVHDWLQKVRMERAYDLLQDGAHTIGQVAEAVGYQHACNFSTAFQAYFGCAPHQARGRRS